mmetsp:Transcript_50740/g.162431  ORF Transcript_50740/g.162431 Transcript_50740/m.162431 type:complete len:488 (+) Transcript_50740:217-1680(+)
MDLLKSAKSAATSAAKDAAAGAAKTAMATGMSAKNAMECRLKSGVHDFAGDSDVVGYLGGVNVEWDWNAEPKAKFGHRMKELHFNMPMGRCLHNSGSYGVTPTCVLKARHEWEMKCQENTVLFRFITCPIRLPHVVSRLAYRVGADPNNLALMTNANQATSTVFKSISWSQGDKILLFSCDYHATHLAVEWLEKHRGVEAVVVDMPLPCTAAEALSRTEAKLKELAGAGSPPKLANFCHVTSKTGFHFPAAELTALFHEYGVPVCIDGAQAAGHVDVNVTMIGAEYYIGTVHKWMYSCQGMAFLVAQPPVQGALSTLTVSYFAGAGFEKEFEYTGLQDFTTWISYIQADEFVDKVCGGWTKVRGYCSELAQAAVAVLEKKWGTKVVQGGPEYYGNMPIMPVPGAEDAAPEEAVKLMAYLLAKGMTCFCLYETFGGKGQLCIRLSVNIYHEIGDYEELGDAVAALGGTYTALPIVAELVGRPLIQSMS